MMLFQVAVGRRDQLQVFGGDYATVDGTGVRDYIHIYDLAVGHVSALSQLMSGSINGCEAYNLGTGQGYSVLQVLHAFEEASGKRIPFKIVDRREGDIASSYADASLAKKKLGWMATKDLLAMCVDTWHWQSLNPNGFH